MKEFNYLFWGVGGGGGNQADSLEGVGRLSV